MIKSYGNKFVFDNSAIEAVFSYITHLDNPTSFDAYEASSRDEVVPSTYTTLSGGTAYSNFDTASTFYEYNVGTPDQARNTVIKYAGRLEGGDFSWDFSDPSEDAYYGVNTEYKNALIAYTPTLVSIQAYTKDEE